MCRIALLSITIAALSAAQSDSSFTCENTDCVSGFICKMEDNKPTCVSGGHVTCDGFDCDVGHHCEIVEGAPRCLTSATPDGFNPELTCANVLCAFGTDCKMSNGAPNCVKTGAPTCDTVECSTGLRCEISTAGTAECLPDPSKITCANVDCVGPCKDTPTGPQCGPRPLILPIPVGPYNPSV